MVETLEKPSLSPRGVMLGFLEWQHGGMSSVPPPMTPTLTFALCPGG